jgi:hypothetical protein
MAASRTPRLPDIVETAPSGVNGLVEQSGHGTSPIRQLGGVSRNTRGLQFAVLAEFFSQNHSNFVDGNSPACYRLSQICMFPHFAPFATRRSSNEIA